MGLTNRMTDARNTNASRETTLRPSVVDGLRRMLAPWWPSLDTRTRERGTGREMALWATLSHQGRDHIEIKPRETHTCPWAG